MQITITDVRKRYGDVVALDGPSFEIRSGSTFGVLGTNGAGKTTLFELLVGYDEPDAGRIEVGGIDAARAGHRVRERVGFLPEHAGFPPAMTGREVLSVHARVRGLAGRDERIEHTLDLVGLTHAADRAVSGYSNGMGRRLGLAAALLAEPPVLVLDEPTAGLDPQGVDDFHRIVERIDRETGATVVLSSHALAEVERLCDEVAILHDGRLRAVGPVDALCAGVGDRVVVTVRPADRDGREAFLEAAATIEAATVERADETLTVACGRADALALAATLAEQPVERVEIEEPGLGAAFRDAVTDGAAVPTEVSR